MPRRILLLARRDYFAAVLTKSFVISLLLPLLIPIGLFIFARGITQVVRRGSNAKRVMVVDRTGLDAAASLIRERPSHAAPYSNRSSRYNRGMDDVVFELAGADRATLIARVRKGELAGILELESTSRAVLHSPSGAGGLLYIDVMTAVERAMREVKLRQSGLDPKSFAEILKPAYLDLQDIDNRKESLAQSTWKSVLIPMGLVLLMLFTTVSASTGMLSGVAEDKKERVFEMMLAAATPLEIITGKVLGSVGVSLTASLVWMFYALAGLLVTGTLAMTPVHIIPWFLLYLVCQLTMLSAAGAAIGAASGTPAEAQRFSPFLLSPLVLPVFVMMPLLEQPNAAWCTVLSFLPPLTPMMMLARQASPMGVPAWQPWVALAGVLAWTCLVTWIASRVFRVGLLLQGSQTGWADVARWALRG